MNIEIVSLNKECNESWNRFCVESNNAWFCHTTDFIDFQLNLRPTLDSKSMSFMVKEGRCILCICIIFLEKHELNNQIFYEFSFGGDYCPSPAFKIGLTESRKEEILKFVFSQIDEKAREHDVKRVSFRIHPLCHNFLESGTPPYNYLMKHGFFDNSINTQIINISLSDEELRRSIRKGHKYDINRGRKTYEIAIFDHSNIDRNTFDNYRLLHHKAAGRITRPLITFDIMFNWIKQDSAFLVGLLYNQTFIAFSLFIKFKDGAYYGSAADDPDVQVDVPIAHIIQWKAIEWLKNNKIKYYEIGWQQFGNQFYDFPSYKDKSISFFKRGFGGLTVPLFRGEKFYDENYLKIIFDMRIAKLLNKES